MAVIKRGSCFRWVRMKPSGKEKRKRIATVNIMEIRMKCSRWKEHSIRGGNAGGGVMEEGEVKKMTTTPENGPSELEY